MQIKHLKEINRKFKLPVLQFPMMQQEIRGIGLLKKAADVLAQKGSEKGL